MSKVLRMLASGGIAAVLGVVLLGLSGAFVAQDAAAQAPPARPARFAGSVTVDGQPATAGTVVQALVNGVACGVTTVFVEGGEGRYVVDVDALEPAGAACGTDGATVSFTVGGQAANETGTWHDYQLNLVNLTVTTATPVPTTVTPTETQGTATKTTTPKAPPTGMGTESGTSNGAMFVVLGLGALALGASGAAVARRSR